MSIPVGLLLPGGLPLGFVVYSFFQSDLLGQLIVIALLGVSIFAWSIMYHKRMELGRSEKVSYRFRTLYQESDSLIDLFLSKKPFAESPLFCMYEAACMTLAEELKVSRTRGLEGSSVQLSSRQVDAILGRAQNTMAEQAVKMETYMDFLAVAVSASPLLGLFGTVWGVMGAFNGMAVAGASTLSAVAPGIAGALLTTVTGLIVAIPSTIAYNFISSRLRRLEVLMDNFVQDFEARLRREYTME